MFDRQARARWTGGLKSGQGVLIHDGAETPYSFASRFGNGEGTTPEELLGAAHAGCFSMALSLVLEEHGYVPGNISTTATVRFDPHALAITGITLDTEVEVSGIQEPEFRDLAEKAKQTCPLSKALAAVPIVLRSVRLLAAGRSSQT